MPHHDPFFFRRFQFIISFACVLANCVLPRYYASCIDCSEKDHRVFLYNNLLQAQRRLFCLREKSLTRQWLSRHLSPHLSFPARPGERIPCTRALIDVGSVSFSSFCLFCVESQRQAELQPRILDLTTRRHNKIGAFLALPRTR